VYAITDGDAKTVRSEIGGEKDAEKRRQNGKYCGNPLSKSIIYRMEKRLPSAVAGLHRGLYRISLRNSGTDAIRKLPPKYFLSKSKVSYHAVITNICIHICYLRYSRIVASEYLPCLNVFRPR